MRIETSAGGVVFKKTGDKIYLLLIKDQNDRWTFPKGLIEPGEDPKDTAKREIGEETGVTEIEFFKELAPVQYWYKWEEDLIKKTVHYFLFETKGQESFKPQKEEGITEVRWVLPEEAEKMVGYPKTNEKILDEVNEALKISTSS
ncbi:MAG: NUDIX hydrolase [bacterium]|nr:NUDIX hydrolase [bacterium]